MIAVLYSTLLSVSLSLTLSFSLSHSLYFFLPLAPSLSFSHTVPLSLSISLSLFLSLLRPVVSIDLHIFLGKIASNNYALAVKRTLQNNADIHHFTVRVVVSVML